jgi:hypothetical protein
VKATVRTDAKRARRSVRQRELDVALSGKHTVSQAAPRGSIRKMARDPIAVLENMPITINDFRLLVHRTSFANDGLKAFAQEQCGFILKARTKRCEPQAIAVKSFTFEFGIGSRPYRKAGITSLPKSGIDLFISSCAMPPKLKVVVNVSK